MSDKTVKGDDLIIVRTLEKVELAVHRVKAKQSDAFGLHRAFNEFAKELTKLIEDMHK